MPNHWLAGVRERLRGLFGGGSLEPSREQMYVRLAVQLELERPAGKRAKSILLTSPRSEHVIRETAMELAYTVAEEMGRRVLLIDADFGLRSGAGTPGLTDLLVQGVEGLTTAVRATSHERLFMLSAGSRELTAASLAAGRHRELIARACDAYESVIVIGAPVLREAKWLMLAPLVDHSLLLAVEGRTHVSELDASLRVLSDCKAAGVGVVLTSEPPRARLAEPEGAPASSSEAQPQATAEPRLHSRTDP